MKKNLETYIKPIMEIARTAGSRILEYYQDVDHQIVELKPDQTPLTEADLVAHDIIDMGLRKLTPKIPFLSEESAAISYEERKKWKSYWLVDPLDGTKEFIKHNGEFTVNIALIEDHKPILGVVHLPVSGNTYFAWHKGGAYKCIGKGAPVKINTRPWQKDQTKIALSRRVKSKDLANLTAKLDEVEYVTMGSSLKICLVASGVVDLYPCLAPTSEWDSAAGQCLVEEAGGAVLQLDGKPLNYNTKESLLNPAFLVIGDPQHDWVQYFHPHAKVR